MIEEKINSIIGKPYDAENYNCWHMVMELQPLAPSIDIAATRSAGIKNMNEDSYANWEVTESPSDLDICLLGNREDALHHAGVFYNGMIVHNDVTTVRAEPLAIIKNKYKCIRFYKCLL